MLNKHPLRIFVAINLAFALCSNANASGAVAGATEPTQIMNNLQLVASYAEQAQQTATQIQQYQAMLRNLVQMTPSQLVDKAAQNLWVNQDMANTFKNLRRVVVAGQQTSYTLANIDSQFKQLHPGYGGYGAGFNFQNAFRNWSDNSLDAIKNSLAVVSAHADDFDTEKELMTELRSKSMSAQGQLEATQAGSQIGLAMVGQFQKLRQLQMAQMQSQNAFMSAQTSTNDAKISAAARALDQLPKNNPLVNY